MPAWSLLTAFVTATVVYLSSGPLDDPDVWWHIRLGRLILDTHHLPTHETWSYAARGHAWTPTAWLSDALYGGLVQVAGYRSLIVLKLVVCAAVCLAVLQLLRRTRVSAPSVAIAFTLTLLPLTFFLRERPQAFSLLFVVLVAAQCERVRRGEQLSLAPYLAVQWLWANVHGMWFLGPLFLLVAATGDLLDAGVAAVPRLRRHVALAAGAVAVAGLTPVGPRLVVQPLQVHSAAHAISEWLPTVLWQRALTPYLLTLVILLLALARRGEPTAWADSIWVVAVVGFSLIASRDVAPAVVLLAAPLAHALEDLVALPDKARLPLIFPVGLALVGVGFAVAGAATEQAIAASQPTRLVRELGGLPAPRHLLNDYTVGGLVTGLQPKASVAIDGRTDNYSPSYVDRYLDTLRLTGNWQQTLAKLRPDCALLPTDAAMTHVLLVEYGWTLVDTEHGYSLLERGGGRVDPAPGTATAGS